MPANYMRRCDLLRDAGFDDAEARIAALASEIATLRADFVPAQGSDELRPLLEAIAGRVARIPPAQSALAALVPEWLTERNGDLASALWLARAEHRERLDLAGFLFGVLKAFLDFGRVQDALTFARFMLDLRFDWDRVYGDPTIAYAFMQEREPNPLVWKLLDELQSRAPLRVLELGCGVGNDALGFLRSPLVESYQGVDLAEQALTHFRHRLEGQTPNVRPTLVAGDLLKVLEERVEPTPNLVYSYSSLHYFASSELQRILELVRGLLLRNLPGTGFFAFAIKGAGSLWEGQGLPLYRPDVWINRDGQSRWFPSQKALARQLDKAGFEVRLHEVHDHWGYSEHGRRDVFHYVLCSPRAEYAGASI